MCTFQGGFFDVYILLHCLPPLPFLDKIVALKRLKMEKEKEGFPITSLREVCTLLKAHHENIVRVQVSSTFHLQIKTVCRLFPSEIFP